MTNAIYFVGLDIAAEHFHAALGTTPWQLLVHGSEFANTPDGFQHFLTWLQQYDCTSADTQLCMEATGVYGEALAYFLAAHHYRVAIEPPLKVKRAFKVSGPKTDPVDSEQIAEYACRYADELQVWQPPLELLEQLKVLLTTREQLVQQSTAQQNALQALQRKSVRTPFAEQVHQRLIVELKTQIQALEHEMRRLIDQQPPFQQLLNLLLTIPGVGLLLATQILVLTHFATQPWRAAELASHFGLCPHERRSGKSVYARPTSRHYGPKQPRKLLHLAARSVTTHNPRFSAYYQRKLEQGKPKPLALNNVANKLLKVICAVLKTRTPYDPEYCAVSSFTVQS